MTAPPLRWLWLPTLVISLISLPLVVLLPRENNPTVQASSLLPVRQAHVDHSAIITTPFSHPQEVTARCLECHEQAAQQVLHSPHFTWDHEPVSLPGRTEPARGGKKNVINNFCIGVTGNWEGCSSCHAGYGWKDQNFDFSDSHNIDCLVCHEQTGTYVKGKAGMPVPGVDLLAAAQSVAYPSRSNCGGCHFDGGGGDAVKHGDLDSSLYFPSAQVDVHMGKFDMVCTDCHRTREHQIAGRSISLSLSNDNQISCNDCHAENLHNDQRLNQHTTSVACQTCHIPEVATRELTKTHWDWSKAGDASRGESHNYKKIKGEFQYAQDLIPDYLWYSGVINRYLYGDSISSESPTPLNKPTSTIQDRGAKIFPFKVHVAQQVYDTEYRHLLQPKTFGETGYWSTFDWHSAIEQGSALAGLPYSGHYGFTETTMYWPQTHMVQPAKNALQCRDCHNENANNQEGRLDWHQLGYPGDPIRWGSRAVSGEATP